MLSKYLQLEGGSSDISANSLDILNKSSSINTFLSNMCLKCYLFALLLIALTAAGNFFLVTFFVILDDVVLEIALEAEVVAATAAELLLELLLTSLGVALLTNS